MNFKLEDYIELYKIAVDEIHKYHGLHQRRVAFFSSLLASLITITVTGLINAKMPFHYMLILIGPLAIVAVSLIAINSINGVYRLLLETITTRAKLDQLIGLNEPLQKNLHPNDKNYWENETLVPSRHLKQRMNCAKSSKEWIEYFKTRGLRRWTNLFFYSGVVAGIALFAFTICLAIVQSIKNSQ